MSGANSREMEGSYESECGTESKAFLGQEMYRKLKRRIQVEKEQSEWSKADVVKRLGRKPN